MSGVASIRPFFRQQLDALGYREWKDGFNFTNIPSSLLDRSYHLSTPSSARLGPWDQASQELHQDVVVRVFLKGFKNPAAAIDDAMSRYDNILTRIFDPSKRLGCEIKNIYLNTMEILPFAESNDNSITLEITFSCLIIFG